MIVGILNDSGDIEIVCNIYVCAGIRKALEREKEWNRELG